MPTAKDVAQYIVEKKGRITTIKLQKLVYYCQAWSLVWDDKPLFDDEIQAWANGPVVPSLFQAHKGSYSIDIIPGGNSASLTKEQKETVDVIIRDYGDKSSQWLVDLTHLEDPWKDARGSCRPGERCVNVITLDSMANYYSGI